MFCILVLEPLETRCIFSICPIQTRNLPGRDCSIFETNLWGFPKIWSIAISHSAHLCHSAYECLHVYLQPNDLNAHHHYHHHRRHHHQHHHHLYVIYLYLVTADNVRKHIILFALSTFSSSSSEIIKYELPSGLSKNIELLSSASATTEIPDGIKQSCSKSVGITNVWSYGHFM